MHTYEKSIYLAGSTLAIQNMFVLLRSLITWVISENISDFNISVLFTSLKLSTLVRSQLVNWYPNWCSRVWFPHFSQTCSFKIIWCQYLVKQLWPPGGCRRTKGRLSTSFAAKGCVLYTQQERSLKWIDPSEWWWREERLTRRESLWLPASKVPMGR